jgi:GTP cyclohydrolase IA
VALIDRARAERAVHEFLIALGRDPERDPDLRGTPARVVDAYATELLAGYDVDVPSLLSDGEAVAQGKPSDLIALTGIAVSTICPHHLLLSQGTACVAYRPGARLFGLGTLARLVNAYARRLSLQESIGENVAEALVQHGGALGAYCEIRLVHGCLVSRGSRETTSELVTTALRGDIAAAELALALRRRVEATA